MRLGWELAEPFPTATLIGASLEAGHSNILVTRQISDPCSWIALFEMYRGPFICLALQRPTSLDWSDITFRYERPPHQVAVLATPGIGGRPVIVGDETIRASEQ
jgi:hypothetical protein